MSISEDFGKFVADFINNLREENIKWKQENILTLNELESLRRLSKQETEQALRRRQVYFKYKLQQKKKAVEDELKDFQDFLSAIDQLKDNLKQYYPNMPVPLILIVHQHVTQALVRMWDSNDFQERSKYEQQLLDFFLSISEDINLASSQEDQDTYYLPEKTLKLIKRQTE